MDTTAGTYCNANYGCTPIRGSLCGIANIVGVVGCYNTKTLSNLVCGRVNSTQGCLVRGSVKIDASLVTLTNGSICYPAGYELSTSSATTDQQVCCNSNDTVTLPSFSNSPKPGQSSAPSPKPSPVPQHCGNSVCLSNERCVQNQCVRSLCAWTPEEYFRNWTATCDAAVSFPLGYAVVNGRCRQVMGCRVNILAQFELFPTRDACFKACICANSGPQYGDSIGNGSNTCDAVLGAYLNTKGVCQTWTGCSLPSTVAVADSVDECNSLCTTKPQDPCDGVDCGDFQKCYTETLSNVMKRVCGPINGTTCEQWGDAYCKRSGTVCEMSATGVPACVPPPTTTTCLTAKCSVGYRCVESDTGAYCEPIATGNCSYIRCSSNTTCVDGIGCVPYTCANNRCADKSCQLTNAGAICAQPNLTCANVRCAQGFICKLNADNKPECVTPVIKKCATTADMSSFSDAKIWPDNVFRCDAPGVCIERDGILYCEKPLNCGAHKNGESWASDCNLCYCQSGVEVCSKRACDACGNKAACDIGTTCVNGACVKSNATSISCKDIACPGDCDDISGKPVCVCPFGKTGDRCDVNPCSSKACGANSFCTDKHVCQCNILFAPSGADCAPVPPVNVPTNLICGANTVPSPDLQGCLCIRGYTTVAGFEKPLGAEDCSEKVYDIPIHEIDVKIIEKRAGVLSNTFGKMANFTREEMLVLFAHITKRDQATIINVKPTSVRAFENAANKRGTTFSSIGSPASFTYVGAPIIESDLENDDFGAQQVSSDGTDGADGMAGSSSAASALKSFLF
eukprot:TRINITY_DN12068_c0_g1_i1.p1 TRINITY_DN12068_c0_g1~~TRINITY_DN12068_c0_g1_i1.p1  ORF type:complete len:830 (+),score=139.01 TRINITY_DN12068_c0_g1_i1:104-2491(+)